MKRNASTNAINIAQCLISFPNQTGFWCNYIGDGDGEFIRIPELLVPDINRCINKTDHGRAESGVTPSSYRQRVTRMTLYGLGREGGAASWPGKIVRIRISVYFDKTVSRRSGTRALRCYRKNGSRTDSEGRWANKVFGSPRNVHVHEKGEKRGRNFKRWLLISS